MLPSRAGVLEGSPSDGGSGLKWRPVVMEEAWAMGFGRRCGLALVWAGKGELALWWFHTVVVLAWLKQRFGY